MKAQLALVVPDGYRRLKPGDSLLPTDLICDPSNTDGPLEWEPVGKYQEPCGKDEFIIREVPSESAMLTMIRQYYPGSHRMCSGKDSGFVIALKH